MYSCHVDSPIGSILLTGRPGVLTGLYVADHHKCPAVPTGWTADDDVFAGVRAQLGEYFAGTRTDFDVEVEMAGTPFQRTVWAALCDIPYGETWSYGKLAAHIGRPGSSRAVGAANGRNPVSIIVPCHRVIGADGSLTGYGWGNERKSWLLDHEAGRSGVPGHSV
ncbi:MAG: methylated-DNA--[protein]-cysteine S-methyltransferase [Acidimicrobiia bacterium]